jgi:hypothetical protein
MQFRCSLVTDSWQTVVVPSWHAIWAGTFYGRVHLHFIIASCYRREPLPGAFSSAHIGTTQGNWCGFPVMLGS